MGGHINHKIIISVNYELNCRAFQDPLALTLFTHSPFIISLPSTRRRLWGAATTQHQRNGNIRCIRRVYSYTNWRIKAARDHKRAGTAGEAHKIITRVLRFCWDSPQSGQQQQQQPGITLPNGYGEHNLINIKHDHQIRVQIIGIVSVNYRNLIAVILSTCAKL